jgi:hypothetical protein
MLHIKDFKSYIILLKESKPAVFNNTTYLFTFFVIRISDGSLFIHGKSVSDLKSCPKELLESQTSVILPDMNLAKKI